MFCQQLLSDRPNEGVRLMMMTQLKVPILAKVEYVRSTVRVWTYCLFTLVLQRILLCCLVMPRTEGQRIRLASGGVCQKFHQGQTETLNKGDVLKRNGFDKIPYILR